MIVGVPPLQVAIRRGKGDLFLRLGNRSQCEEAERKCNAIRLCNGFRFIGEPHIELLVLAKLARSCGDWHDFRVVVTPRSGVGRVQGPGG